MLASPQTLSPFFGGGGSGDVTAGLLDWKEPDHIHNSTILCIKDAHSLSSVNELLKPTIPQEPHPQNAHYFMVILPYHPHKSSPHFQSGQNHLLTATIIPCLNFLSYSPIEHFQLPVYHFTQLFCTKQKLTYTALSGSPLPVYHSGPAEPVRLVRPKPDHFSALGWVMVVYFYRMVKIVR